MEAPEKLYMGANVRVGRFVWLDRENEDDIEYIRSDLCTPPPCKHGTRWPHECRDCFDEAFPGKASTMPRELVERMRQYLAIKNYRDINIVEISDEIIRDILAWHEGKKQQ